MSLKKSNSSSQQPIDAANAQPAKKTENGTTIVLPDDVWSNIMSFVDSETLPALACAGKTTRDAAVFTDFAESSFSLVRTGVVAGVLRLLKYSDMAQLEALAKLCGRDEGFADAAFLLEARKRLQKAFEKAYEAGKATKEEVFDGALSLGRA